MGIIALVSLTMLAFFAAVGAGAGIGKAIEMILRGRCGPAAHAVLQSAVATGIAATSITILAKVL